MAQALFNPARHLPGATLKVTTAAKDEFVGRLVAHDAAALMLSTAAAPGTEDAHAVHVVMLAGVAAVEIVGGAEGDAAWAAGVAGQEAATPAETAKLAAMAAAKMARHSSLVAPDGLGPEAQAVADVLGPSEGAECCCPSLTRSLSLSFSLYSVGLSGHALAGEHARHHRVGAVSRAVDRRRARKQHGGRQCARLRRASALRRAEAAGTVS